MIGNAALSALDTRIVQLHGLIRQREDGDTVAAECEAIINAHTGPSPDGALVRPSWRQTWRQTKTLSSGWFDGPSLTKDMADALYELFVEAVRFVMEPQLRKLHRRELTRACRAFMQLRYLRYQPTRPVKPTRRYCMRPLQRIRWIGEVRVEPRLWQLLDCILRAPAGRVSFLDVAAHVYGTECESNPKIQKAVSALNSHLEDIRFPSTLYTEDGVVYFDRPL